MRLRFPFLPILFSLLVVLHISCEESAAKLPPAEDEQTSCLNNYLETNYGDSIPGEVHYYFMITKKATRDRIAEKLVLCFRVFNEEKNNSTLILSSAVSAPDSLLFADSKTDWDGAIDQLNILFSAVTVIRTEHGKVVRKEDVMDQDEKFWSAFKR